MPWQNTPESRQASSATYDAEYRRNRPKVMRRDRWRCRLRIEGVCIGAASQCDHIVSGGGSAMDNLQAACAPCHAKKTAQQGGGFRNPGSGGDPEPRPRTAW